jgi:hypothetical protein
MQYVEQLRMARSVRTCAIVLGLALALNIAIAKGGHVDFPAHLQLPITIVWAFAGIVTSIFASVIGASIAAENDGHLPVAWTKPVSRVTYATATIATDLLAIAFVYALTCLVVFIYFAAIGVLGEITIPQDTWAQLVRFFIAPAAFYGLLQALTSTLVRQAGMVLGFTWVGLITLATLAQAPLVQPYHAIVATLDLANPLIYVAFDIDNNGDLIATAFATATAALVAIAALGGSLAVYRWQRSEA